MITIIKMEKVKKKKTILGFVFLLIFLGTVSSGVLGTQELSSTEKKNYSEYQGFSEKVKLLTMEYVAHASISIIGNAEFSTVAQLEGWDGNGSSMNPYVIEGLEIGDLSTELISIRDTDVHFTIRNNLLDGKSQTTNGIKLTNVTNGMISSNEIKKCLNQGIVLVQSDENEVSENTITDNGQASSGTPDFWEDLCGIYLRFSDSNVIKMNTITGNVVYGVTLDSSSSNLLSMNTFNDHEYGIGAFGSSRFNVISENSISTSSHVGIACYYESASHNLVTNNTFSNNNNGIGFRGTNNTALDNIFSDNTIAISLGYDPSGFAWEADQSVIVNNLIYNNSIAIELPLSTEADILNNSIFNNENYGLKISSSSSSNVIKWNDFVANYPDEKTQVIDDGTNNEFNSNFWGGKDAIAGTAENSDVAPSSSKNNPDSPDAPSSTSSPGWSILAIVPFLFLSVRKQRHRSK